MLFPLKVYLQPVSFLFFLSLQDKQKLVKPEGVQQSLRCLQRRISKGTRKSEAKAKSFKFSLCIWSVSVFSPNVIYTYALYERLSNF
jgi:hypothetical protein